MFGLRNRRKIKNTPVKTLSRRWKPAIEILEDRTVPTVNLYVDFGDDFTGARGLLDGVNPVTHNNFVSVVNGPDFSIGAPGTTNYTFTSFNSLATSAGFSAGQITTMRANIMATVQRYYAPFDVNVIELAGAAGAQTLADINALRVSGATYMLVAGVVPDAGSISSGLNGQAGGNDLSTQTNSTADTAVVLANNSFSNGSATTALGVSASSLAYAYTVAHEAGHTFGLRHTDNENADNNRLLTTSDIISKYYNAAGIGNPSADQRYNYNFFTRYTLAEAPSEGWPPPGTENPYNILGSTVGFKPGFSSYVTGTGANDHITISNAGGGNATVTVQAYSDAARTVLISTQSYNISTANGILAEGGFGSDLFEIDGTLGVNVTLRGMNGNSTLLVQGNGLAGNFTPSSTTVTGLDGVTYSSGAVAIGATSIAVQEYLSASQIQINNSSAFTYLAGANADVLALNSVSGQVTGVGALPMVFTNTNTLIGVNGGANNDQFNITPAATIPFNVNGGGAAEVNTATFDLAGVTNPVLTYNGPNSYTATFGNRATVTLVNIQGVNAINGAFAFTINGTNQNDVFRILRNGANVVVTLSTNGGAAVTVLDVPANTFNPINFNGLDGNDQLIVDESGGTVTNTLNFDGGNPVYPTTPGDSVLYTGGSFLNLVYNATGIGAGNINLDGNLLNFVSTEPITVVSALGNVTINLVDNAANHTITLGDDGTLANNLSKVTIDAGIESLTFTNPTNTLAFAGNLNFSNVVILNALDTASLTPNINLVGGNVNDEFRITSLRNGQSVNVLANAGTDSTVVGGSSLATFNTGSVAANLANVLGTVNVLSNSTSTVYIDDSGFAGGRTITSDDIPVMPFFFAQGVHTTVNGLTTAINVNNGAREVQTAGGAGNDTFRVNTTLVSNYSNGTTESFFGNNGNDNFFVRPSTSAGIFVYGGSPSVGDPGVPPNGDRLVVYAYGATVSPLFSPDGVVIAPGFVPVTFNNIEFVSVPDRFEINDTPSQATFLGSNPFISEPNLSIHSVDDPSTPLVNEADVDYFRYVAHDTGYITINAQYLSVVGGQLVVEVYRATSLTNLSGPNVIGAPFNNAAFYQTSIPAAVGSIDGTTLNVPVVKGQIYYIKVRGNNQQQDAGNYNLEIENFAAPVPTVVNLPANLPGSPVGQNDNDTGRSNTDGITNNNTPYFIIQADLRDLAGAGITMLTSAQANAGITAGAAVQVFVRTFAGVPITSFFADPVAGSDNTLWSVRTSTLADGNYQITASTVIFDNNAVTDPVPLSVAGLDAALKRKGSSLLGSPPLNFTIDTVAPASPSFNLNPPDDTGINGQPGTFTDRITKNAAANFTGTSEPAAWMQFYAQDRFFTPQFGGTAYANAFGQYFIDPTYNLNDPTFFDQDGERMLFSTATDVAGNVSAPQTLLIFLDTRGPQVAGITYRYDQNGNPVVIDLLNQTLDGVKVALPQINYIDVTLVDQPNRTDNFLYPAANELLATTPGNYAIIGKKTGNQTIQSVVVLEDDTVTGGPGLTTYRLFLSKPLPDDKFTFKILDRVQDEAGNALDGDFQPPFLPSGDGNPGGNFVVQFLTVDSRAELGTYANGSANLDLNGDFIINTGSNVGDDAIIPYAPNGSAVFAGQFYDPAVGTVDGFDRLGTYGKSGTKYVFRLDFNNDGDFSDPGETIIQTKLQINGLPIAGNWGPSATNLVTGLLTGSNVGVFDGTTWYLDTNGNNIIETAAAGDRVLKGNMKGLPFTGDFDGDGLTDLGTYLNGVFYLDLTVNEPGGLVSGFTNYTFKAALPLQVTGTASKLARPVAADFDGDGITDIGLFIPNQTTVPAGQANWYLMNSNYTPWDIAVPNGSVRGFKNVATGFGNDIAVTYGSAKALPVVGNFDPSENLKPAAAAAAKAAAKSAAANLAHNLADMYFESTDSYDFVARTMRKGKGR